MNIINIQKENDNENPLGIIKNIANNILEKEKEKCIWKNSILELLNNLKIDSSGKVGELFIEYICNKYNIPNIYIQDINSKDGTYDIIIKGKKIEIKTAKIGKNKTFQHENLRISGYDYLLFIDICPNYYYITIVEKFNVKNKSIVFGIKPHLRKGTSDVYKFDYSEIKLKNLLPRANTIVIDINTSIENIVNYINCKIT